ncbi:hypothetical protein APR12_001915 [Nocardia amikacinitolerans]|uniref:hypothetical protein n=1 Tax=Nocardia amikacinitolerans TaxID=756689 RepID=UPI0009FEC1ED|nr:hypothetical protein [Nocardia amikacinitolerans]MCP2316578.1 hypothetical protein [Nocardia amikacinitolerans]
MDRLGVVDEIFLRTHRGLGTPIALQGLWRTADRVEPELLQRIHDVLRSGPLGRRVVRPRVPGARRGWRMNTRAHPLLFAEVPLRDSELLPWADGLGGDLDPEFGPGWRLAAAPLADGGTVVVLTCSHALADARGLVYAVDVALRGVASQTETAEAARTERAADSALGGVVVAAAADARVESAVAGRAETTRVFPDDSTALDSDASGADSAADAVGSDNASTAKADSTPEVESVSNRAGLAGAGASAGRLVNPTAVENDSARAVISPEPIAAPSTAPCESDWADAVRQWSIVVGGTVRALRHGIPVRPVSSAPVRVGGNELRVHSAVVRFGDAEWDSVAEEHGGTANSLFIHLIANLLWATGFPGPEIGASLPVDTRDEPRVDNDLAMTEIVVDRSDTPATLRAKARAAYEHRMSSPGGMPEELLQVIPDRWAYALSKGAGERDILCSNIGTLPDSLRTIGTHPCIGVAARAIHPGLTASRLPRTRLSGYLCRTGDDYFLSLVALDLAIESATALRELTVERAARLGLTGSPW